MLKKIAITAIATSSLMVAAQASALTGIHVNGNLGYANQSARSSLKNAFDPTSTATGGQVTLNKRSKKHFAWTAFGGYNYDFNDDWGMGLELGYGDFGQTKWKTDGGADEVKVDQTAWMLLASSTWHADENFDVFLKAGAAFGKTDYKSDGGVQIDGETSKKYNNTRAMTVLGAAYNFMPEFGVNLEWDHIFGTQVSTNSANKFQTVDAFMAGLKYTFEL